VFFRPSSNDFDRYIIENDAIIVRMLGSEAPLQKTDGMHTPSIEKILVDIVDDIEFSFLQGSEIHQVYSEIFDKHKVNEKRLLRYAARRGRKQEVIQLLKINML